MHYHHLTRVEHDLLFNTILRLERIVQDMATRVHEMSMELAAGLPRSPTALILSLLHIMTVFSGSTLYLLINVWLYVFDQGSMPFLM